MAAIIRLLIWLIILFTTFFFHLSKTMEPMLLKNTGDPAYLTPLINAGNISRAKSISYVKPMKANIFSNAGFFTVKNTSQCISNMFFWFFHSYSGPSAPVVLWLQGGPGISSLVGVFEENGPFYVKPKRGLKLRQYSWIKTTSILYIDNPVGSGFSFTNNDDCYAKNGTDVADNLLEALKQFFVVFPEYQKNDFYIIGQSYAGKFVPTLALHIDKFNKNKDENGFKINLKGISIGNGFCDPVSMLSYGNFLYQIGLIDVNGFNTFRASEKTILNYLQRNQFDLAFKYYDELITGHQTPYKTLFYNLTGFTSYFNYWFADNKSPYGDLNRFIQSDIARRSIHVGNLTFQTDNTKVVKYLINDIMQSVKPFVESVLYNNYRVLIYSGQLDIIVPYPLTVNFLKSLDWSGKKKYATTKRELFVIKNNEQVNIVGYIKQVDNLIEIMIRDAGQKVSKDQPIWALEMITRFTYNKPFKSIKSNFT